MIDEASPTRDARIGVLMPASSDDAELGYDETLRSTARPMGVTSGSESLWPN
jgi:hypothetical protein